MINQIQAKCEIFKEDDRHFALCPKLDVICLRLRNH